MTETKDKFQRLPVGGRAVQIADGNTSSYFLDTFGRSPRLTVCAADVKSDPSLSQSLHLLNGPTVEGKIAQGGLIQRWMKEGLAAPQIVKKIYVRALTRKPTAEEVAKLVALVPADKAEQAKVYNDIFWAVLNSREFVFNH